MSTQHTPQDGPNDGPSFAFGKLAAVVTSAVSLGITGLWAISGTNYGIELFNAITAGAVTAQLALGVFNLRRFKAHHMQNESESPAPKKDFSKLATVACAVAPLLMVGATYATLRPLVLEYKEKHPAAAQAASDAIRADEMLRKFKPKAKELERN